MAGPIEQILPGTSARELMSESCGMRGEEKGIDVVMLFFWLAPPLSSGIGPVPSIRPLTFRTATAVIL